MFDLLFSLWKSPLKDEPAKKIEEHPQAQVCYTYVYSFNPNPINILDYFSGGKNEYYKKLIATDNGRADIDKCLLYADLSKLMKTLTTRHSPPPPDLHILHFDCAPEKVIEAIKNGQFHTRIIEAYTFMDLWRHQENPKLPLSSIINPHHENQPADPQMRCL